MTREPKQPKARCGGFAIVVVLSTLLILTTIFAITSARSIQHLKNVSADVVLADRQARDADKMRVLLSLDPTIGLPSQVTVAGETLTLVDVGGLIDMNTAAPAVLQHLFRTRDFPETAATDFIKWRQQGRRLQRVDDIIRITGATTVDIADILQIATVYSGRRGIATEVASPPVIALMNAGGDSFVSAHTSPASLTNYAVFAGERYIGSINIPENDERSGLLDLR